MTQQTQAVTKPTDEKVMEFVPFGAKESIKLSVSIIKNIVAVKTKTGKTCSENDAIKFLMMCKARGLNPFEGDAFLIGYDGREGPTFSLITAHQAFLKRAELNAEYDGMKSGIIVKDESGMHDQEGDFYTPDQTVLGGWATVFFKNRKQPMHKRIRMERFKKPFGIWLDDAAGMICKCAEADALRSSFPTMLGGLYLKEEVDRETATPMAAPLFGSNVTTVESTVTPQPEKDDSVLRVGRLCQDAHIPEETLLEFMAVIGLCEPDCKTLEEAHVKNNLALGMVVEKWAEFSTKIKETIE